jgi:hypothetical protein
VASGRPAFGSRFNTGNMESALLTRGFHYGSAPNSVVIGWNGGHAAVTLPDGTPVSSGESNHGVRVGGGGAYQPQFSHHMYLPVAAQEMNDPAAVPATPPAEAGVVELASADAPVRRRPGTRPCGGSRARRGSRPRGGTGTHRGSRPRRGTGTRRRTASRGTGYAAARLDPTTARAQATPHRGACALPISGRETAPHPPGIAEWARS